MDSDDPTEELVVDITEEVPEVEDRGENNGPPLLWFGLAAILLAGAIGLIFAIGRNRDDTTVADEALEPSTTLAIDETTEETPPIGDPGASATDDFDSTADTSPPDEASEEATSTPSTSSTTSADTSSTSGTTASDEDDEGSPTGQLIVGEATINATSDDFEISVVTSACTTIEWSFAGDGQSASYTSEGACFDEHLLSPRPEHPLLPATQYEVTASFAADGVMEVVTFSVTTAP